LAKILDKFNIIHPLSAYRLLISLKLPHGPGIARKTSSEEVARLFHFALSLEKT